MILWRSKNSFCKKYSGGWTNTVRRRLLSYTCETTLSKVRLNWENQNEKPLSDLAAVSVGALLPLNPNGSLVQYIHTDEVAMWRFKHPTVGDAYAGLLLQSPELLGIYVHGSPIDKLLGQVTCGDVGLERAVVL